MKHGGGRKLNNRMNEQSSRFRLGRDGQIAQVVRIVRVVLVRLTFLAVWLVNAAVFLENLAKVPRDHRLFLSASSFFLSFPDFGGPSLMREGYAGQFRYRVDQPRNFSMIGFFRLC